MEPCAIIEKRPLMSGLWDLSLIRFLDFYFMLLFLAGTARRFGQYRNISKLALTGPGRWPRLLGLIREHRTIFMTWATVAPALLALALTVVQLIASRMVWPGAARPPGGLTVGSLMESWLALSFVAPLGLAMLALDMYSLMRVGDIPREEMEKYFDQAEFWLKSKTAHVVHVFTLGYINPRKMVAEEVRKSLEGASDLLNSTLWWVSMQTALRFSFGLALWLTWALSG
jgi:hypothetical protein